MRRLLDIWRLLNAPCRDMMALMSRAMDTELSRGERFAARLHLVYCKACRRYRQQLLMLRDGLRRAADAAVSSDSATPSEATTQPTLSADARRRIEQSLRDGA
jgi:hypothetical protein